MTTDANGGSRGSRPRAVEFAILFGWHAVLSGAFVVAYLSGDEDTFAMHQFAGYLVLAAILLRLAMGIAAPAGSPLRLPRPDLARLRDGMAARRGAGTGAPRRPLLALMAILLLAGIAAAAGSGAVADFVPSVEAVHEALGELALWIVLAHVALVAGLHGGARCWRAMQAMSAAASGARGRQ